MNFGIFKRAFVVRRFEKEQVVNGYGVTSYGDVVAMVNVQPAGNDNLDAQPEGEKRYKRMRGFSTFVFNAADQSTGRRGDWLYYQGSMDPDGHWYECVSSTGWDHTLLSHCESQFVQVSDVEAKRLPEPTISVTGASGSGEDNSGENDCGDELDELETEGLDESS